MIGVIQLCNTGIVGDLFFIFGNLYSGSNGWLSSVIKLPINLYSVMHLLISEYSKSIKW